MKIRKAKEADVATIIELMRDFAEYEKLLDYFEATADKLFDAMFGERSFVQGLIAEKESEAIGYAIFYPNYATFRGQRGVYLEDIYISPSYQGQGIGEAMIRHIATIAKEQGCERIDFQVLEWNMPAIGFYERLGAVRNETERHFKFTDAAFEKLAS
jgi:ribosomal protein S18 acetylase RimI-like enzyme